MTGSVIRRFQNVLVIDDLVGDQYVKLPGTIEETLDRLERDGVWGLVEHAVAVGPSEADLLRDS